jgi:hypothetical protein
MKVVVKKNESCCLIMIEGATTAVGIKLALS